VRRIWDEKNEIWYFSIIDVVEILTDSLRPRKYWNALKTKLKQEGSELSQKVGQLKLESADGKEHIVFSSNSPNELNLWKIKKRK
jgi:DNA-damage-inducible protein D